MKLPMKVTPRDGRSFEEEVAFQWEALTEERLWRRSALREESRRLRLIDRDNRIEQVRRLPMAAIRTLVLDEDARRKRHSARNTT